MCVCVCIYIGMYICMCVYIYMPHYNQTKGVITSKGSLYPMVALHLENDRFDIWSYFCNFYIFFLMNSFLHSRG